LATVLVPRAAHLLSYSGCPPESRAGAVGTFANQPDPRHLLPRASVNAARGGEARRAPQRREGERRAQSRGRCSAGRAKEAGPAGGRGAGLTLHWRATGAGAVMETIEDHSPLATPWLHGPRTPRQWRAGTRPPNNGLGDIGSQTGKVLALPPNDDTELPMLALRRLQRKAAGARSGTGRRGSERAGLLLRGRKEINLLSPH